MPRSKKNSKRIIVCKGRPMIIQSELYKQYERECAVFLPKLENPISSPINLKCTFIVPDKRKRDLTNLLNAIQDILVKYKILEDDNYNIVNTTDGSQIIYEKNVAKTIIEINFK
jgi:Holliday junction resolvase RusA-like endonuclease